MRSPEKVQDFADRGVQVVQGDYADAEGLAEALRGADKWIFISSSGPNEVRLAGHLTAVAAGKEAGVGHVIYTSIPQAETNPIGFADVHKTTEAALKESGLPYTFLRNNWYWENLTGSLGASVEHGAIIGSVGEGRIAYATRADYAARPPSSPPPRATRARSTSSPATAPTATRRSPPRSRGRPARTSPP
ncbi:NAD(P)H-binding protein [Catenulispora yoronensis]